MLVKVEDLLQRASDARRDNRSSDAHRDFVDAVGLCRQSGPDRNLIRALKGLGQVERDLGRTDAARSAYEEAVALCRQEGDSLLLAHTVRHLGDILQEEKQLDLAEACSLEAISLYRENQDVEALDLANAIRPLAILKERNGDFEEAITLWEQARGLYETSEVYSGVNECSSHIAQIFSERDSRRHESSPE